MRLIYRIYAIIFARKIFFKFNRLLYSLSLRGMGVLNFESDKLSGELNFIKQYVAPLKNPIIFDIGANQGNYAKLVRRNSADAEIYCFEPHPITFQKLTENTSLLNTVNSNVAVGSEKGSLALYDYAIYDGSSHASLYREVVEGIHKSKSVKHDVMVIKLDDFVSEHNIQRVNLLKIDTEGHELEVLKGIESFISNDKVDMIHFEFNEMNVSSRVFFKDFWAMLSSYDIYRMLPNGLVKIDTYNSVFCEIFAYQNIVAMLKVKS